MNSIMNEEETPEVPVIKTIEPWEFIMRIPDCCRESRDDCPHVLKKPERIKQNIGL